ncbi:MAG: NADH-dependent oxidoreductase [Verrucomicrobiales bacterium]|nr:NADH-dependent oxidoreductase [Verrucomicrobiales bacterium]
MKCKLVLPLLLTPLLLSAEEILVEAESFDNPGGWKLDTQFIDIMGSPYLLAHGLGNPVDNASTKVDFDKGGEYHVWVRTQNWVEKFSDKVDASAAPGRFQLQVGDTKLDHEFGKSGADWQWEKGGTVTVEAGDTSLSLHDLTGFDGRCDAILFSTDADFTPDNSSEPLPKWRRKMLGVSEETIEEGPYDIVFIGGGYAGSCGAISAARMGLKVALIQNRPVLGGNGSSEVRVWAMGNTPPGLYPVGDIIREFEDDASKSPGTYEEFEDEKKEQIIANEPNIDLFLNHHAFDVKNASETHIESVLAFDTRTSEVREFKARNFCDSTGHGTIGKMAGADYNQIPEGRMGMSNMWAWENAEGEQEFPEIDWALSLTEKDFPYPRDFHAQWFWESGFDKDPIEDLEDIRDWNLLASYSAWNAIKNNGVYDRSDPDKLDHKNARLTWLAYIGGTRETLQLLGDIILTEEDIVTKRPFPDGCVLTTWSVDLHYPKEQYAGSFPDNPFISVAVHGKGVDRKRGYPVPYRCFYSRNIENLFMAGRNISVTHKALGTVRVMKTCGMMGVVVGKAAALSTEHDVTPREVYYQHLDELIELLKLPGNVRRASLGDEFAVDPNLPDMGEPEVDWIQKNQLTGIVIDDEEAELEGKWNHGAGLKPHVEDGYHYSGGTPADADAFASATFTFSVPEDGDYEVRIAHQPHENRSSNTPVTVVSADGETTTEVNQKIAPPLEKGFFGLGIHKFEADKPGKVVVSTKGAKGNVHIDAVQVLKVKD